MPMGMRQSAACWLARTTSDICGAGIESIESDILAGKESERAYLFRHDTGAVVLGHALDTGADTHVDLAVRDHEGDVVDGDEAGRALPVDGRDRGGGRETG